jgi:surfactin synthase thioesterase subunit
VTGPTDEEITARLADAIMNSYGDASAEQLAAALLPVVREIADRRAAEARAEGAAGALNTATHEVNDDDDAELLARRAIQWEAEAAALRGEGRP